MTTQALAAVSRAIAKGVVVVRSTRVGEGVVRRNIEVSDDKIGTGRVDGPGAWKSARAA
jgi:L-asparaginase